MKPRLFTPGPTPVPEDVTLAMAAPMPHHRTPEFQAIMQRTTELLQRIYRTEDPVVLLAASGTGAMEAAVVNLTLPGEKVVSVNAGKFGGRWGELLRTYGRDVHEVKVPWGQPGSPEDVLGAMQESGAQAVFVTHSETSTGALCDLQQIAFVARQAGVLLVVDAITSLGAHRLETQQWGLDCVVGGSQKAFMLPPGLAFLSLSARARERLRENPTPRYYFDLGRALHVAPKQSPWTPAITLVMGLERGCQRILDEGLERVWLRHQILADAVRAGVEVLGLRVLAARPSNAVTAAFVPEKVDADGLRETLWKQYRIKVAGGQDQLKGKIIRIGHLGDYDRTDVVTLLAVLEEALRSLGHAPLAQGAALAAAHAILARLDSK